jgi:hypothetical protein
MHGSAVLVWIGMATAVPISYLFFSIKAIQDPPAEVRENGNVRTVVTNASSQSNPSRRGVRVAVHLKCHIGETLKQY